MTAELPGERPGAAASGELADAERDGGGDQAGSYARRQPGPGGRPVWR